MALPLPEQKNYEISRGRALDQISQHSAAEIALNTGGKEENGRIVLQIFRWEAAFDCGDKSLTLPQPLQGKSTENLILHYLAYSRGVKPAGNWINFYQIKDATLYLPVFNKRTIGIIQKKVKTAADFRQKCAALGGTAFEFTPSAIAYRFDAFPLVPLLLVYYEGDDEIQSEMKFMFDSSVVHNLSAEDAVVTAQFLSLQFLRI